jgi:mannose-1-phosphate guanylyltransferase
MEKVSNRLVVKGDFSWDDIGSWTSMERIFPQNKDGNVIQGGHEGVDTKRCVIVNDEGLIVTIGLSDLVIISSGDIKLIYPKKREGDLKKIIKRIANNEKYKKYL